MFSDCESPSARSRWVWGERVRNFWLSFSGSSQGRRGSFSSAKQSFTIRPGTLGACASLSAKTFSTGAARSCIGVFHLEPAIERIDVIQFAAGDVKRAFRIHYDPYSRCLHEDVAICRTILKIHQIGRAHV